MTFGVLHFRPEAVRGLRGGKALGLLALLLAALLPRTALALDPHEKPGDYILAHWDAENGLPQSMVRQIAQTRDGYLWIGTLQGLARFDGLSFASFDAFRTPGLAGNRIGAMAETADGSLWIATSTGLSRYRDGRFTAYFAKDGLKANMVNALCVAPDGSLWIGSRAGITRWVGERFVDDIDTSGFDLLGLQSISVDREKAVWVVAGAQVLRYREGKFVAYGREQGLPDSVLAMAEDAEGRMLAVTQQGLWRKEGERFVAFQPAPASPRINAVLADRDGNLWIGSVAGLERLANGVLERCVDPRGEKLGEIDALFEDREGSLWVGGSAGLVRMNDRHGRTISVADGVLGTSGLAAKRSRDGSLWLSSWAGGVARIHAGEVTQYRAGAPLSHDSVTCIYEGPDGTMWFGNRGSALDRLKDGKVTTYVLASGVATSRYVSAMHTEPDGQLLIAIAGRGLLTLEDEKLVTLPESAVLGSRTVTIIQRTRDGRLLLGTTGGLFERRARGVLVPIPMPGLSPEFAVLDLLEDADGSLWLATNRHGLVRWKDGATRIYGEAEGMIADSLAGVLDDGAGSLWVASSRGIGRILRREFSELDAGRSARLHLTPFGRKDGLQSASTSVGGNPVAARLPDGRLLFATDAGFAAIDAGTLRQNNRQPTVIVESIVADDRTIALAPGKTVAVPAGTNRLEIRYTALSLLAPQLLRFRYSLEGSDSAWVEAGHERSARYTHLAPGDYTFRVLACNSDGVWNETGATVRFTVQPFFYQTAWFAGLVALGAIGLAVGAVGARARLSRQRLAALEAVVSERTRELRLAKDAAEQAREEIARERARFKFIFESLPVGVTWMVCDRPETRLVNPEHARITGIPATAADATLDAAATHPEDRAEQAKLQEQLATGRIERYSLEKRYVRPDGSIVWAALTVRSLHDAALGDAQHISTLVDITGRKDAEASVRQMHQQLLETSRQAGMAEVATSVLHNVGNVLNSVNVSASMVADRVRRTKAANIAKIARLFDDNKAALGKFLTEDSRGQAIPGYLGTLATNLADEQKALLEELGHLKKNVDHIKDIVSMQQANARFSGVIEQVSVTELIEDALRITAGSLERHHVAVMREFCGPVAITTDKHKVMQVLINLLRNAKQACQGNQSEKRIVVRTTCDATRLKITVIDNGVGISAENLKRIFNHGFTTRKDGHGFGLHSGALAAKELGGELLVESEGPGLGATFTLDLPLQTSAGKSADAESATEPQCATV